jgi:branched-chain amino acid transport system ATP-binding protein
VIVEQDTTRALAAASRVYCLRGGRVTLAGQPAELTRAAISQAYFGA